VALAEALIEGGQVELASHGGLVTDAGGVFFGHIGIDLDGLPTRSRRRSARVLCRPCLDWSERRPQLAGTLGAALCVHSFGRGWIRRNTGTRAVTITPTGQRVFREEFRVRLG